jgi:hypothetical protein
MLSTITGQRQCNHLLLSSVLDQAEYATLLQHRGNPGTEVRGHPLVRQGTEPGITCAAKAGPLEKAGLHHVPANYIANSTNELNEEISKPGILRRSLFKPARYFQVKTHF